MGQNSLTVRMLTFRDFLKKIYEKYEQIIVPLWKVVLSFAVLMAIRTLIPYDGTFNSVLILAGVSVLQIFLPLSFLYITGSLLIGYTFWNASAEILVGFALIFMICLILNMISMTKYSYLTIIVMILFMLKLEYLVPVIFAVTIGFAGIVPAVTGAGFYYYIDAFLNSNLAQGTTATTDIGASIQAVIRSMISNKEIVVIALAFVITIFITTILYHMFNERAWMFGVIGGNVLLALALLGGRLAFSLNFAMWRVFLFAAISALICFFIQFFKGIGDVSRIEKISFEDEEYIYYVKAVPKIKVSEKVKNITAIETFEEETEEITETDTPALDEVEEIDDTVEDEPVEVEDVEEEEIDE